MNDFLKKLPIPLTLLIIGSVLNTPAYANINQALEKLGNPNSQEIRMEGIKALGFASNDADQQGAFLALENHYTEIFQKIHLLREESESIAATHQIRSLNSEFYDAEIRAVMETAQVLSADNESLINQDLEQLLTNFNDLRKDDPEKLRAIRAFWQALFIESPLVRRKIFDHTNPRIKIIGLETLETIVIAKKGNPREVFTEFAAQFMKTFSNGPSVPLDVWAQGFSVAYSLSALADALFGETEGGRQILFMLFSAPVGGLVKILSAPRKTRKKEKILEYKATHALGMARFLIGEDRETELVESTAQAAMKRGWSLDFLELSDPEIEESETPLERIKLAFTGLRSFGEKRPGLHELLDPLSLVNMFAKEIRKLDENSQRQWLKKLTRFISPELQAKVVQELELLEANDVIALAKQTPDCKKLFGDE